MSEMNTCSALRHSLICDQIIDLYLGPDGTKDDANAFYNAAIAAGFEWDGGRFYKNNEEMSETEWQQILAAAFRE